MVIEAPGAPGVAKQRLQRPPPNRIVAHTLFGEVDPLAQNAPRIQLNSALPCGRRTTRDSLP